MGNVYMQKKEYQKAVEAYKNALRNNPSDEETRYNYALAKELLEKEKPPEEQEQDDKNEDEKEQDKNKDKEEQDKGQKENNDEQGKKDKPDQGEEKEQKAQPKPIELSPREAEQMLEAAKNEDQKLQMQLRRQQAKTKSIDKDW